MARLGDVCKLVSGNSLPEAIVAENGELPYVKVAELNLPENIPNITTSRQFVSVENISAKQIVPVGTVIFPKRGGAIATNKKRLVSTPICMDLNLMGAIPSSKLYPQYLYYFFENIDMGALSNGSSVPQINNSDIAPLEIRIPDITTQKDIAIRLDKVTELIALRKEQLAKLDELVKSRFIELFGDPVLNPYNWDVVTIGDIVTDVKYGTSKPAVEGGKYPYLRMNNLTYDGHLDLSDMKYIDIPDNEIEKCIVRKGDVLFNRTNSIELVGKTCVFDLDDEMVIAGYIIRVRLNEKLLPIVLSSYMNSTVLKEQLRNMAKGAVNQANINAQELQSIKIYLPPLELQNQFAAFVEQTDKSKLTIQQSLDKLELMKKALMQEYFG